MKLVDVPDSKSGGPCARVGSTPTAGRLFPLYLKLIIPISFSESVSACAICDIFNAADRLAVALVEGFSGAPVEFGTLRITTEGEPGDYTVRIELERYSGSYVLFDEEVRIEEDKPMEIRFRIPYLCPV